MDLEATGMDDLSDEEVAALERTVAKLTAAWAVKNLQGLWVIYWDDQHVGEKRRPIRAMKHPSVDLDAITAFAMKPVVDNLEGNSLWRVLNSPVIVVNDDSTRARATFWSYGVEGLSKFREQPMAIWTIGVLAISYVKEDGEWRVLQQSWHRITKNNFHKSWVYDMLPTNTRPPLTAEQDRAFAGKDAYYPDEIRRAVPEPPADNTWDRFPDEADLSWINVNVQRSRDEEAFSDLVNVNKAISLGTSTES
jgi:hypothetical protein